MEEFFNASGCFIHVSSKSKRKKKRRLKAKTLKLKPSTELKTKCSYRKWKQCFATSFNEYYLANELTGYSEICTEFLQITKREADIGEILPHMFY